MKNFIVKTFFCANLIILAVVIFSPSSVFAQNKDAVPKLTANEKKEAEEIATQFTLSFVKNKTIASNIEIYYLDDFIQRHKIEAKKQSENELWMTPFLTYRLSSLSEVTTEDWIEFYKSSHDFFLTQTLFILKEVTKSKDKEPNINKAMDSLFSAKLKNLLSKNPNTVGLSILRGESSGKSKSISSVEEMKNVIQTLNQAVNIINAADKTSISENEIRKVSESFQSDGLSKTRVEITTEEYYGFPKGTRVISVVSPLMISLELVKIDNKLKIFATIPYAE